MSFVHYIADAYNGNNIRYYHLPVVVAFQKNIYDLPVQVCQDLVQDVHVSDVCILLWAVVSRVSMCFCSGLAHCILCELVCCLLPKTKYTHIIYIVLNI